MLSQAQMEQYHRDGYVIPVLCLPADDAASPRRGMTMSFMPTTSVFDRAVARELHERMGVPDHAERTVLLMSGVERSGKNDLVVRR